MSSATEEHVREHKLGLLSLRHPVLSQPVTLEVHPDSRIALIQMSGACLEITGDVFEQYTENLMQLPSHPGPALGLKAVISIPRLLLVPSAPNSSSMRGFGELSITTSIGIPLDSISLEVPK